MDLEEQKKADYKGQGKLQDVIKIIRMIIINTKNQAFNIKTMFCFSRQVCKETDQHHSLLLFRTDTVIMLCILLEKGNYITLY